MWLINFCVCIILYTNMFLGDTCIGIRTYFNLLAWIWASRGVVKRVSGWCFRGIYNGAMGG